MQLEFAMLADAVLITADNKLIIQGANVDNVRATAYPAVQPTLALIAMFGQEPSDRADDVHEVRVETRTPTGEPWLPPIRGAVATPFGREDLPAKSSAIFNFSMLLFPVKGRYVFQLYLDERWLRDLLFFGVEVPQSDATPATDHEEAPPTRKSGSGGPSATRKPAKGQRAAP